MAVKKFIVSSSAISANPEQVIVTGILYKQNTEGISD